MAYWLMKSEPHAFSIDDLKKVRRNSWDGVRNYQARNMMRDDMRKGDLALFYHSNCKEPGVVGVMKICREAYPDDITFGRKGKEIKANADSANPTWFMVDVQFQRKLKRNITLREIRTHSGLADLLLVRKGNRLSVMPVSGKHWDYILGLE
ncbi:MAG: EVE domain-containing protein [Gammaproteobacteria bacterium]|nr:MAG: EVE domain-containing protein [Gammaproteobacteria bacterium]